MNAIPALQTVIDLLDEGLILACKRALAQATPEIVLINERFEAMTGFARASLVGRNLRVLRGTSLSREHFSSLVAELYRGQAFKRTVPLIRADGSEQMIDLRCQPIGEDGQCFALWLRPAANEPAMPPESAVVLQARILAGISAERLYLLSCRHDLRLALTWADPRLAEISGYPIEELKSLGGMAALAVVDDRPAIHRRNQALLAGEPGEVRYGITTRSGSILRIVDRARPLISQGDTLIQHIVGSIAIADDQEGVPGAATIAAKLTAILGHQLHQLTALVDDQGRLVSASPMPATPMAEAIRGLVGNDPDAIMGPAAADQWLDLVDRMFATHDRIGGEVDFPGTAAGRSISVQLVPLDRQLGLALFGSPGTPRAHDQRWHASPEASRSVLRAILDEVDLGALLLASDRRPLEASERALELLAISPETFAGVVDLADLLDREGSESLVSATAIGTGRSPGSRHRQMVELRGRGEDARRGRWKLQPVTSGGEVLWLLTAIERDARGTGLAERADTTFEPALRPLEREPASFLLGLEETEELLRDVGEGIVCLDEEGKVTWSGAAASRILATPQENLLGRPFQRFVVEPADGQPLPFLPGPETLASGSATRHQQADARLRRPSGEIVPVEILSRVAVIDDASRMILTIRDLTVHVQTEDALRHLAYHDPLTGLANRLLFHDRLTQAIARCRRERRMLAVLIIDLDRFKLINDSLGLDKGDMVLRIIGERLSACLRQSDTVARLGGDEFMIMLSTVDGAEAAAKVAQKIVDAVRPPITVNGHELSTAASLGISLFPHDGDDADILIKNADTALSRAKDQGRNHFQFYTTDMNASAFERLMLESRLRKALDHGELVVYYQPLADLQSGRITTLEALIRWFHPELGLVPPGEFIPLAEETGLIIPIGAFVMETACAQLRRWQVQLERPDLRIAINLSARQFQEGDLVALVRRITEKTQVPHSQIELELTESVVMRNPAETVQRLTELTALGVGLAIDDFGTGYSSLAYLRQFPIRSLKIDRSFVQDLERDQNAVTIAKAIIALGKSLGLKTVAEGVENRAQLAMVREFGCSEMQGYLLSRPLPAEDIAAVIRRPDLLEPEPGAGP